MIRISTDKDKLDISFIHKFLTNTYWAKGRTMEEVKTIIENSYCFGIYSNGKQIGFARVVTDYVVFAYIMDVFIAEEQQGKGYSSLLMDRLLSEPAFSKVKTWRLATADAHFLYEKFGFGALANPEKQMEKIIR
ncbi:MAG: GNAT family N-acetyltransferase [Flavobacterium lindanitolerans]|jgi:GNAT superfamily N-acetyltransferase|uniref:GNAT family N-acetyltransferase n=1 Tax=Flavobacterium lindanitolerans TaxID=428988 RepID=UPI001A55F28D|nr:GNAT family N-acetyltransferase [Flavobacterium lindanitolerans]MBL7868261.1 GNAT family N-acetyltransferase [Flavobacterium lindanitolerans]